MKQYRDYSARLVVNVTLWGQLDEVEATNRVSNYATLFSSRGLDTRILLSGLDESGQVIVSIRFNGEDIDKVAECLDVTASDLLSREVGLGNPYEARGN